MRKVKLVLDDLEVETFAVESDSAETRGTVEGLAEAEASGVHTNCYSHCGTDCEGSCTCPSQARSHCAGDSCGCTEYTCFWDCGIWSDLQ
jgi:hypothetical protein